MQLILVGISDEHIRLALEGDDVTFVIPFHGSGNTVHQIQVLMNLLGENLDVTTAQDYTAVQSDHVSPKQTKEQKAMWDLRVKILTGKASTLTAKEFDLLNKSDYLKDLYTRFYINENAEEFGISLTSDVAKQIFPYEYWDKSLTYAEADKNGERFKEYCASMGIMPRFSGMNSKGENVGFGDFTNNKGYWKLLIDRPMYDNTYDADGNWTGYGKYHEQQKINCSNFQVKHLDPEYGSATYGEVMSKANDPKKTNMIVDRAIAQFDNAKNNDTHFSDRYSYDALTSKPDMKLTMVGGTVPTNRADVVSQAKKNAASIGKANKDGSVSVYVNDVDTDIVLSKRGLLHGLDRRLQEIAPVTVMAGEILQNSIKINDLTPSKEEADASYVLIGAAQSSNGDLYIVRSVVNKFSNELDTMDVLYAINAKKSTAALNAPLVSTPNYRTTISIAELLDFVNRYFPDILPESVLRHFGYEARPEGELGESVLYSDRDSDRTDININESSIEDATLAADFVTHMEDLINTRREWYGDDVFKYVTEHPELNFIDRIYEKDAQVKKDLDAFLNTISDVRVLHYLSWYMGEAYGDKDRTWDGWDSKASFPYRGAVRTFRNAIKKRTNAIMTEQVGGTNLGVKNGEVSLEDIKDMFYRLNSNEDIGKFAEKVFATAEKLGVNIRFVNQTLSNNKVAGDNFGDMVEYKTSYFNDTAYSDQHKARTLLHELIHVCTVYVLHPNRYYMGDVSYSGKSENYNNISQAATRLNRIYSEIKNDPAFAKTYGIKSVNEMVAELANEEFVGLLKEKNLWDRIVDWICELFGINRGTSAYENARMCVDYILDNPEISDYKNFVGEARQQARRNRWDIFGKTIDENGVMYSDRVLMGSLFSGGGTLEAGLVYQMLDKEFAVEYNKKIAATYTDNHGKEHMFVGDVRDFNSKDKQNVFYLHASPVCKNFSPASHSGGETTLDITTAQATARVLEEQMPQVFTVENVKRYIGSEAYNIIVNKLNELGYTWDVAVYKASDYGNATKRERMIIRAVKDGELPPKPQKASKITSWGEATRDLWETDLIPSTLVRSKIEAIKNTPELKNLKLTKLDKPLMIYDTTKSKKVTFAWADELAPTLTTKCGDARIIMPDGRAYAPTPRFMGRIQGLPDDYKYPKAVTNAFKIIGNGIPTQLTKAVMGGVLDSAYEQTHDGQVLYSDRSPSSVSTRSLLANALETTAQNDIEKTKLAQYKGKIELIEAEYAKLSEIKKQANDLRFTKGRTADETKKMKALDFEANQIANRINVYDRQLLNLEATTALKNVLQREKKLAYDKAKKEGKDALAKYREKAAKTQKELMNRNTESRKKAIESRDKTEMRGKIKKVVGDLKALLLDPTKDKHVPIGLQKAVAEALDIINMDTVGAEARLAEIKKKLETANDPYEINHLLESYNRISIQGENLADKLTALKSAYAEIKNSDDPLIKGSHDESIETLIHNTAITVGETSLRDMSYEQLEAVYDMYKAILTKVRDANKMFKEAKQETITANSEWTKREISAVGGHRNRVLKATKFLKKFGWNMLKPIYAMKLIGSDTLTRLYENVRKGEDTWAVDVNEAKEFFHQMKEKYKYNTWDFKKPYKFTDSAGHSFSLTLEQIMSLYAYSKRSQADKHLEVGGFIFDDAIEVTEKNKLGIPMKYEVNDANPYRLKKEHLGNVIGILDTDALKNVKGFVDEMQAYLSDVMGAKGNEVSLAMYDIKLYKEKNYFPLKSAKYFREFDPEKNGTPKIKNSSFSKKTVPQAGNPIILSNFMDVWANHVNDMSMYHAFVLPLEDFMRVYNYSSTAGGYDSVQQYIKNAYGAQANTYIETLMNDLNGGARTDPATDLIGKGMSLFKKAAVFASASVVIQQPSAIARATAYIDPKYFVDKPEATKHKETWAEVKKYAPVAIIKEMGYFDTNMGRSTVDWIRDEKTWRDKVDDLASKAPALADELAWSAIWKAVKREVADSTNLKVGSEEFLKMVGKRFTEVVTKTQVYDSVLSRSALMRSKDTGAKMVTAFMAEPTTSLNMVVDAIIEGKRGNKKFAGKVFGAVSASIILNSILVSLVTAARDDDDDETYTEKYLESLTAELLDGFNPLTYIPLIKDIWSIMQGYDVERSDMSIWSDLWASVENLFSDKKSGFEKTEGIVGSIASIFGLPVKNLMRDARAMYNLVSTLLSGTPTTWAGVGEAVGGAVKSSIPLYDRVEKWVGADKSKSDNLYDAIIRGDQKHIDRVKAQYKDDKAIEAAIRQGLRENDSRIKEAAKAHASGDIRNYSKYIDTIASEGHFDEEMVKSAILSEESAFNTKINQAAEAKTQGKDEEYKKIVRELRDSYRGIYSQDEIVNMVTKAQEELLKTEEDDIEEATSIYKASDVNSAFESGDTDMALEVIEDLINTKVENYLAEARKEAEKSGKKFNEKTALNEAETKAKSSIRSSMTSYWKPLYKEAYKSGNTAEQERIKKILKDSGLYGNASEVIKTIQAWRTERD